MLKLKEAEEKVWPTILDLWLDGYVYSPEQWKWMSRIENKVRAKGWRHNCRNPQAHKDG